MSFTLRIEETTYSLWLGENAPILLFEALGIPLDNAFSGNPNIEAAIAEALTPQHLFDKLKTFETRMAIAAIVLQEGELTPELAMDSAKLARRLEINTLLNLISDVFTWYNDRQTAVENTIKAIKSEADAIALQPEPIQEAAIASQPVLSIAEGE